jgi:dTDP-4-dehydrorhamnose 3,5-epimerase
MIQKLKGCELEGVYEIFPKVFTDQRGSFVKTFHDEEFTSYGLETNFKEQYYSNSKKGVFRGLHFQIPPYDHVKLVYCVSGSVDDVVLDIRKGSPTYGKYKIFNLSSEKGNMVYIPKGFAHGFFVTAEEALLIYNVTTVYSPGHDTGINLESVDIPLPSKNLLVSERDKHLVNLKNFDSPFIYQEAKTK